jgi:hypothetical protein
MVASSVKIGTGFGKKPKRDCEQGLLPNQRLSRQSSQPNLQSGEVNDL